MVLVVSRAKRNITTVVHSLHMCFCCCNLFWHSSALDLDAHLQTFWNWKVSSPGALRRQEPWGDQFVRFAFITSAGIVQGRVSSHIQLRPCLRKAIAQTHHLVSWNYRFEVSLCEGVWFLVFQAARLQAFRTTSSWDAGLSTFLEELNQTFWFLLIVIHVGSRLHKRLHAWRLIQCLQWCQSDLLMSFSFWL